jgi:DNA-binding GntR family transcriptional regulator
VPLHVTPPTRRLLREDVHSRLLNAIIDGTLAPGEQLRDTELAAWLGVSRTPVREALLRLRQTGLVHSAPGRSTWVAVLDPQAIREAHSVVAVMHQVAAWEGVPRLGVADIEEMRLANRRFADALRHGDVPAALSADDDLHAVPVRASGNHAVISVLEQFTPAIRRVELTRFSSVAARGSIALHTKFIDLAARGDARGAAEVSYYTWQTLEPLLDALPGVGVPAPPTS